MGKIYVLSAYEWRETYEAQSKGLKRGSVGYWELDKTKMLAGLASLGRSPPDQLRAGAMLGWCRKNGVEANTLSDMDVLGVEDTVMIVNQDGSGILFVPGVK